MARFFFAIIVKTVWFLFSGSLRLAHKKKNVVSMERKKVMLLFVSARVNVDIKVFPTETRATTDFVPKSRGLGLTPPVLLAMKKTKGTSFFFFFSPVTQKNSHFSANLVCGFLVLLR
jgi:hypothetical protein